MAEQFYTILTNIGKAKIANAAALNSKLNIITCAVGDGNGAYYEPTETQTALKNEVWRKSISSITVDDDNPNWILVETIIPATDGGFTIREAAIFDDANNMIAVGKFPETYKPVASDGSTKDLDIKMILEVSNASSVTLTLDPTVIIATKKDIQNLSNSITAINNNLTAQLSDLTSDRIYYCGTTSGTNTYTAANNKIIAYTEGLTVRVKIGIASTGASTLNINGLGAKTILDSLGNAITSGGLKAGLPYQLCYNGTNFIVLGKGGGGNATADKVLSPYIVTTDAGQITGSIPSKGSQTYNPSTSAQTIASGQYLSGTQTIAAVGGNANVSQVLSGYTFSSANGINLVGQATLASLGGRQYASGTVTVPSGQTATFSYTGGSGGYSLPQAIVTGLNFTPSLIYLEGYINSTNSYVSSYCAGQVEPIHVTDYTASRYTSSDTYSFVLISPAYVNSTGFCLPVMASGVTYNWYAIG